MYKSSVYQRKERQKKLRNHEMQTLRNLTYIVRSHVILLVLTLLGCTAFATFGYRLSIMFRSLLTKVVFVLFLLSPFPHYGQNNPFWSQQVTVIIICFGLHQDVMRIKSHFGIFSRRSMTINMWLNDKATYTMYSSFVLRYAF